MVISGGVDGGAKVLRKSPRVVERRPFGDVDVEPAESARTVGREIKTETSL
jgi:hypothetical protein